MMYVGGFWSNCFFDVGSLAFDFGWSVELLEKSTVQIHFLRVRAFIYLQSNT